MKESLMKGRRQLIRGIVLIYTLAFVLFTLPSEAQSKKDVKPKGPFQILDFKGIKEVNAIFDIEYDGKP
ncbi:MAG: hypothetical protein KDD61_03550, partial [Bdellovibrionales bacterium]|nr:hypothetical protein [Bdellovibrionales bacterium]